MKFCFEDTRVAHHLQKRCTGAQRWDFIGERIEEVLVVVERNAETLQEAGVCVGKEIERGLQGFGVVGVVSTLDRASDLDGAVAVEDFHSLDVNLPACEEERGTGFRVLIDARVVDCLGPIDDALGGVEEVVIYLVSQFARECSESGD
jgi:hypothetical protein